MTPTDLLQKMYDSPLGVALSESLYIYPLVEGTHLLSLALSFGLILFTDLRLIGVFLRDVPVSQVLQQLRPILLIGFVLTFISGILLTFAAGPGLVATPLFPLKLLFIFLAGLNALWFEFKFGRTVATWGNDPVFPTGTKTAGWISLISWTLVVIFGRLIPYFDSTF